LANLTERQRNLLQLANLLSQNLMNSNEGHGVNREFSINLPGFNYNSDLNLGFGSESPDTESPETESPDNGTPPSEDPEESTTINDVLRDLVNEQIEVTTPFGPVTGTLLAVRDDYIVIVDLNGNQVLVRTDQIELVSD